MICKTTPEAVKGYFTGPIAREDARAVEELLNNVIDSLIAKDAIADNIPAIEDICTSLKDEHGIDLPESFVSDYLFKYVETNCPHLFYGENDAEEIKCFDCGKTHTATVHMLCELKAIIDELENSFKTESINSRDERCFSCEVIKGYIRGYEFALSLGKLKRVDNEACS
jgi:hypothetical protein